MCIKSYFKFAHQIKWLCLIYRSFICLFVLCGCMDFQWMNKNDERILKTSSFVFRRSSVFNDMSGSKWGRKIHYWMNYPFKFTLKPNPTFKLPSHLHPKVNNSKCQFVCVCRTTCINKQLTFYNMLNYLMQVHSSKRYLIKSRI